MSETRRVRLIVEADVEDDGKAITRCTVFDADRSDPATVGEIQATIGALAFALGWEVKMPKP